MANFANKTIKEAYPGILHIDSGGNAVDISSTARNVLSGGGTASILHLSTTKVGIGVSDPDTTLEVFYTGATQLKLSYNADDFAEVGVDDDKLLPITAAGGIKIPPNQKLFFDSSDTYIYADTTADEILYIGADDDIILQPDDDLIVQAGTSEYVRFDGANQRVGIGTSSPDRQLHVEGSGQQYIRLESTDNNAILELRSSTSGSAETHNSSIVFESGGASKGTIYYDHYYTAASQKFIIKVGDDATSAMTILGNGRVGIGTTSPAGTLEIEDDSDNATNLYISNISQGAGDEGGNLIFRLSDPGTNLASGDILGDISFTGRDNDDGVYLTGATIRAKTNGAPGTDSMPTQLQFFTNSGSASATQRMCILANGKVGVGTASPATTLDVGGSFSGANIEQTTGTVNNLDVSGCTILELNTVSGNITLNGLANGAVGQILYCYKSSTSSELIINHNSGSAASTDKIYTATAANTTVSTGEYGGFTLIYGPDSSNANRWFMLNGFDSDVD